MEEREEECDLVISFSMLKGSWGDCLESVLKSGGFNLTFCVTFFCSSQETMDCCNTL